MPFPNAAQSGAQERTAAGDTPPRGRRQPQAWLHARARLMPQLLTKAPPWVRGVFDHAWAPMTALTRQVDCLPPVLLDYLVDSAAIRTGSAGYVAICNGESRYVPGPTCLQAGRQQVDPTLVGVAFVSVEDLATDSARPLHVIGHLIDHCLGCAGAPDAAWLSEGGGVTSGWREAGARMPRLFALGYGADEVAQANIHDYFAQSLALYCRDRQRLNVADPQICKWFRSTLWNESFWRGQRPLTR